MSSNINAKRIFLRNHVRAMHPIVIKMALTEAKAMQLTDDEAEPILLAMQADQLAQKSEKFDLDALPMTGIEAKEIRVKLSQEVAAKFRQIDDNTKQLEQIKQQMEDIKYIPDTQPVNGNGVVGTPDESHIKALVSKILAEGNFTTHVDIPAKAVPNGKPSPITIQPMEGPPIKLGIQHRKFEMLVKVAGVCRLNAFLVGPAGSGKSTAGEMLAKALSLPFYMTSVGEETSKSDLLGYMSANGTYVKTFLRTAYEHGGVFLMDEIDAGNANVLTVINALLANHVAGFPDAMIKKHKDFVFVAGGNTYGTGATRQYVGRNQLDAATLDRFMFIDWPIDEALEAALVGLDMPQTLPVLSFGGLGTEEVIFDNVRMIREAAEKLGLRMVVSPRATMAACKLNKAGIGWDHVCDIAIYKGCPADWETKIGAYIKARMAGIKNPTSKAPGF